MNSRPLKYVFVFVSFLGVFASVVLVRRNQLLVAEIDSLRERNSKLTERTKGLLETQERLRKGASNAGDSIALQTRTVTETESGSLVSAAGKAKIDALRAAIAAMPAQSIPELSLLTEQDWLKIATDADLSGEIGIRKAISYARSTAKGKLAPLLTTSLKDYLAEHNGILPNDPTQLASYFSPPLEAGVLERYQMLVTGKASDTVSPDGRFNWIIKETTEVDPEYDSILQVSAVGHGLATSDATTRAIEQARAAWNAAHPSERSTDLSQLLPYAATPAEAQLIQGWKDFRAGLGK